MDDSFNLERFVSAQREIYPTALAEVRAGAKRSHWMWFVFPQIAGLGYSAMAQRYAISGLDEARAYLAHPVLGSRLREIVAALNNLPEPDADRVFGAVDAIKLRSSLTLFAHAGGDHDAGFRQALQRWFGGNEDLATLDKL